MTVLQWLALRDGRPQQAGAILSAAMLREAGWKQGQAADRDDLAAEATLRALDGNAEALRRAAPSTTLAAWVHGCVANVWREMCRIRHREKAVPLYEVIAPGPTPDSVAANRNEREHEKEKVLEAAHLLPPPYGHVLVWKLIEGLAWQEIRARLNGCRTDSPRTVGRSRTLRIIEVALGMLREFLAGRDPRFTHAQKYMPQKNHWICGLLPPLPSRIL